jgi:hypothetical protein
MSLKNRTTKKLISTWQQRLALSGVIAFIVWSLTEENLIIFLASWVAAHLLLSLLNARIPEVKTNFNEEMRY